MPAKKSAFKMNLYYDFQGKFISIGIYKMYYTCNTSFDLYLSIISLNILNFLNIREKGAKV